MIEVENVVDEKSLKEKIEDLSKRIENTSVARDAYQHKLDSLLSEVRELERIVSKFSEVEEELKADQNTLRFYNWLIFHKLSDVDDIYKSNGSIPQEHQPIFTENGCKIEQWDFGNPEYEVKRVLPKGYKRTLKTNIKR